jgi:PAS domain S-box-containing protein
MPNRSDETAQEREARVLLGAALVEAAMDPVVSMDGRGRVVAWNPAAERVFGYSAAEAIGREVADLIIPPELREQHRKGLAHYLATGEGPIVRKHVELRAVRSDTCEFPIELTVVPVNTPGQPLFTAVLRDMSTQRKLRSHQELVLRASEMLASSLDYDQTLRNLSTVVIPAFADWYAVDVVGVDGTVARLETAHRDPSKVALAEDLARRYPDIPGDPNGVQEVMRTRRSQFIPRVTDEMIVQSARDPEHLRLIRELGLRSAIVVPLCTQHEVLGAISFVTAESGREYDQSDLQVAEDLGRRAAQAVENARLFAEVQDSRERLEQQATELEAQTADLERTTADLEAALGEARAANRAKSDFLASVSHELRTPLNAIIGYTQLLDLGVHGELDASQHDDLRRIDRSAKHLLGLINDILNFAKVEAGHVEYHLTAVDLSGVLSRVEELITPQARQKQLEYSVKNACGSVCVRADADKLLQIFVNLLSNAVRFTPEEGRIAVACAMHDDRVESTVSDTGPGIPADKLEAIFEPFVQVDRNYTSAGEGTGLGLSISRELARGMGGDLTVRSEPGKGATFTLSLPRAD